MSSVPPLNRTCPLKYFFFLFIPFSRPDSECLYLSFFPFGPLLHLTNGFFAPTNSRCTFLPLFFLSFLPSPSQQLPAPSIGFKYYCRDLPSRSSRVFSVSEYGIPCYSNNYHSRLSFPLIWDIVKDKSHPSRALSLVALDEKTKRM